MIGRARSPERSDIQRSTLDRREVIVVNPEPVMTRSVNPELPLDAMARGRSDEPLHVRDERPCNQQDAADENAPRSCRASSKAVVSWTQIPEIWTALERRFA
jgi:hypothetical protein